jgi:ribonuclease HII
MNAERLLRAQGFHTIAGVDEAGRGCLAGPVVAAAIILPATFESDLVDDSKRLTAQQRESCFEQLTTNLQVIWAVGIASVEEIDTINILRASQEAMRRAVTGLAVTVAHALVDGLPFNPFPVPQTALIGGDGCSVSIAAASIVAKVTRDRLMHALDERFPGYGFPDNKGYGTRFHLDALRKLGPTPEHRQSFAPVRERYLPGFD